MAGELRAETGRGRPPFFFGPPVFCKCGLEERDGLGKDKMRGEKRLQK
jgi:hypothetical protein